MPGLSKGRHFHGMCSFEEPGKPRNFSSELSQVRDGCWCFLPENYPSMIRNTNPPCRTFEMHWTPIHEASRDCLTCWNCSRQTCCSCFHPISVSSTIGSLPFFPRRWWRVSSMSPEYCPHSRICSSQAWHQWSRPVPQSMMISSCSMLQCFFYKFKILLQRKEIVIMTIVGIEFDSFRLMYFFVIGPTVKTKQEELWWRFLPRTQTSTNARRGYKESSETWRNPDTSSLSRTERTKVVFYGFWHFP